MWLMPPGLARADAHSSGAVGRFWYFMFVSGHSLKNKIRRGKRKRKRKQGNIRLALGQWFLQTIDSLLNI